MLFFKKSVITRGLAWLSGRTKTSLMARNNISRAFSSQAQEVDVEDLQFAGIEEEGRDLDRPKFELLREIKEKYDIKDTSINRYLEEQVILVDENDQETGCLSLLESHLNTETFGKDLTHRAFSLLIFDDNGKLLIQKRSPLKIAFPETWGNSCCSHPLYNIEEERDVEENLGVRRAAVRRALTELNLHFDVKEIASVGRIYYRERGEEYFGESESNQIYLFSAFPNFFGS